MKPIKILIPVDFKDDADVVCEFVSTLNSRHTGIEVTLVHVVEFPVMPGNYIQPMDYLGEIYDRHIAHLTKKMKEYAENAWFAGVKLTTEIITNSSRTPAEEIAAYAENKQFSLVVLFSRHRRGLQNFFSGTELLRIVRLCVVPMIILSPERLPRFSRIALAIDFSEESAAVFTALKPVATILGGRILCVNVNTLAEYRDHRQFISDRNHFINLVGSAEGAEVTLYNAVELTSGIIQFAEDNVANFIAVGTHGRTGIQRLYYGSITEELIKTTTFPLIVFNLYSKHRIELNGNIPTKNSVRVKRKPEVE